MTTEQTCRTCRHAQWTRTSNGRVNPKRPGRCEYPFDRLPLPLRFSSTVTPQRIWRDSTEACPTWERL